MRGNTETKPLTLPLGYRILTPRDLPRVGDYLGVYGDEKHMPSWRWLVPAEIDNMVSRGEYNMVIRRIDT